MDKDSTQKFQDDEYDFPYHHIPTYGKLFTQCFNWGWGINYVATIEFLIDKLNQEKFESLVDVGCGDGRLTKELKQKFQTREVEGIDYSEKAIRLAKAMDFEGTYHCTDILKEAPNKKYDIALLIEVFEHIYPQVGDEFLSAVARLLKQDGLLILTVPHINIPLQIKHYRHFSVRSILDCLDKHFDIMEIIPFERRGKKREIIDFILANDFFVLNHWRLKNFIYRFYKQHLFFVDKEEFCQRIYIKARVKSLNLQLLP
ncbi:MAG TPA: class I SAM-dependent methyltransferase [Coleofasciculaceae cyanobacterium]